jgi:hypothetical protein
VFFQSLCKPEDIRTQFSIIAIGLPLQQHPCLIKREGLLLPKGSLVNGYNYFESKYLNGCHCQKF